MRRDKKRKVLSTLFLSHILPAAKKAYTNPNIPLLKAQEVPCLEQSESTSLEQAATDLFAT